MKNTLRIDERTALLYECVRNEPHNQRLIAAIEGSPLSPESDLSSDVCVVLVPGLLYQHYPESGGDGAAIKQIADAMAIPVYTIPVDGTEGIESAASAIAECLQDHVPSGKSIVLVSLSKGSAEVMHALGRPDVLRAFDRVIAWISISGLPLGTPSMELIMRNPLRRAFLGWYCYARGWRLDRMRELLRHRPPRSNFLPSHVSLIQVVAFPLHTHLKDRPSRRLHRQLSDFGPNDGYALLEELARLPGYLYPVWGVDHYLRGMVDLPARLAKVLAFVMRDRCEVPV